MKAIFDFQSAPYRWARRQDHPVCSVPGVPMEVTAPARHKRIAVLGAPTTTAICCVMPALRIREQTQKTLAAALPVPTKVPVRAGAHEQGF